MKAFNVFYGTGGKSTRLTVLAENDAHVEEALANKDKDYRIENKWSKITNCNEIPLSNVLIADLSVTEFFILMSGRDEHNA